jgi:hypothetical protein
MSTSYTPNLSLPVYDEGDNPGAGSKTEKTGGGLNQQMTILDDVVGVGHSAAGAHKDDVIHKNHLHSDCVDGVTLEKDAVNDYLKMKSGGIGTTQIADDAVTAAKINSDVAGNGLGQEAGGALKVNLDETTLTTVADVMAVKDYGITSGKLASGAVIAGKIGTGGISAAGQFAAGVVDSTALGAAAVIAAKIGADAIVAGHIATGAIDDSAAFEAGVVNNAALASDAVTAAKIAHDNKRTQCFFTLAWTTVTTGTYGKCNGELTSATVGVPMPRAGSLVAASFCRGNGGVDSYAEVYGTKVFAQGDKISVRIDDIAAIWNVIILKNGSNFVSGGDFELTATPTAPCMLSICVEFDD